MSALSIQVPFPVFQDRDGQPLDNGYVWLGTSSLNPQTNPVVAYYDSALTIVATQPLRTLNGFISRAGSPAQVYVDAVNFSILVQDSKGTTVFSVPEGTGISPNASGVVYDPAGTGAVATTVQAKLRESVSAKDFGAIADFGTTPAATNNVAINIALASLSANGGILTIQKGTKWGPYSSMTIPAEVEILDFSGWDYVNSQWTGQIKYLLKTASPGTKNANEFQVVAPYHPAVIIDNVGDGATEQRSSLVFRHNGVTDWQFGPGASNDRILRIAFTGTYAGAVTSGTNVFAIDQSSGGFGFNAVPVAGAQYDFYGTIAGTYIVRHTATTTNSIVVQYRNGTNGTRMSHTSKDDGSLVFTQLGLDRITFSPTGAISGYKVLVTPKTSSYPVTGDSNGTDSGVTFTNTGATGGFIFTLPNAVAGLQYDFYCTVAQNMRLSPQAADNFRGYTDGGAISTKAANKYMEGSTLGNVCKLRCVIAGTWEYERRGTWTDAP
jgi:hypothetical protein